MAIQSEVDQMLEAVALVLKKERLARGISQKRLAADAGFSNNTAVTRIEEQERAPALESLIRLSLAMGIAPSEILKQAEKIVKSSSDPI